jgi:hypothetical protein
MFSKTTVFSRTMSIVTAYSKTNTALRIFSNTYFSRQLLGGHFSVDCRKLRSEWKMMVSYGMNLHRRSYERVSSAEIHLAHIREVSLLNPSPERFGIFVCLRWRILLHFLRAGNVFLHHPSKRFPAVPPWEFRKYWFHHSFWFVDLSLYSIPPQFLRMNFITQTLS